MKAFTETPKEEPFNKLACVRYPDLVSLRIVRNRTTLKRWIENGNFPKPIPLGPNSIGWRQRDIEQWLEARERSVA